VADGDPVVTAQGREITALLQAELAA
jgi:hypothetical protein